MINPDEKVARDIGIIRRRLDALPRIKPPQDAYVQDFSDLTFVAAGAVDTWVTARTFEVPAQKRAVVKYFAMEGTTPAALFFVRFRFIVNGAGSTNYQAPPFSFTDLVHPSEVWIEVDQQNSVELQFRNQDLTIGYTINSRLIAWSWDLNVFAGRGA